MLVLTSGLPVYDPATQTLNEQIGLGIYPHRKENRAKIRRLIDDPGRRGDAYAAVLRQGITQAAGIGVPYYLTAQACRRIADTLPTLPDWTFTEESIPAPYGFCRLATPIVLPVPEGQIPPRMTALAWFQFTSIPDGPFRLPVQVPPDAVSQELLMVVFLHASRQVPQGEPGFVLQYRLNRSFFEYSNGLARAGDPDFYPLDFRNRYVSTLFALLQQQRLQTEQRPAARWLAEMFAELLAGLHRDAQVTIVDIPPEPTPVPPPQLPGRRWGWTCRPS